MSSSMRDNDGIWKQLLESKQQLEEQGLGGGMWSPRSLHQEEEDELSPEESERLAAAVRGKGDEDADAPVTADPGLDTDDEFPTHDDLEGDESEEQLNAGVMDTLNPGLGVAKDMGSGGLLKVTGVTEEEPPGLPPVDSVPPTGEEPDRAPVGSNAHKIDGDIHKEVEDRLKELMAAGIDREEAMSMAMDQTNARYKNNPNVSVGNKLTRDSFEVRTTMKTVTEEFVRRNQNIRHYSVRQAIEAETARRLGLDQLDEFSTGSTHGGKAAPMLMASNKKKLEEWVPAAAAVAGAVAPMLMGSNKKKLKEGDENKEDKSCPVGYFWCSESKKCKKKDSHDADMKAANDQTAAMAGMSPESVQKEAKFGGKYGAGKDHRNVHTDMPGNKHRAYTGSTDSRVLPADVKDPDAYKNVKGKRVHPSDISQDERLSRFSKKPTKHLGRTSTAYTPDQSKGLRGGERGEHPELQRQRERLADLNPKKPSRHVGTSTSVPGEAANYMAEDDDGWATSGPKDNTPLKISHSNPHPDEKNLDDHSDSHPSLAGNSKWWSYDSSGNRLPKN